MTSDELSKARGDAQTDTLAKLYGGETKRVRFTVVEPTYVSWEVDLPVGLTREQAQAYCEVEMLACRADHIEQTSGEGEFTWHGFEEQDEDDEDFYKFQDAEGPAVPLSDPSQTIVPPGDFEQLEEALAHPLKPSEALKTNMERPYVWEWNNATPPSLVKVPTTAANKTWLERPRSHCAANKEGDCYWSGCPQNRDNEPHTTGRSCPLPDHQEF
jgi:hypothetical protein